MKKNIFYTILFISAFSFSACEKFLDETPVSQIAAGDDFYTSVAEVDAGVVSIYFAYKGIPDDPDDFYFGIPNLEYALTEMRTDNAGTRTGEGEWGQFEHMNVDPTNATVGSYWTISYNLIYQANNMIQYLDVVEDATTKDQLTGEIYFMRALTYFNLVRLYGGVPLIDKVVSPEEAASYSVRASETEIYNFIVNDLTNAVSLLQTRSNVAEGRATKGAAQALLAKVYLTMKDYTNAQTLLQAVIDSPDYALVTSSYNDVFYSDINSNPEAIFAVQYLSGDALNSEAFSYAFSPKGRSGGVNWPTDDLLMAVDTTGLTDSGNGVDLRTSTLFMWNQDAGGSGDWQCGKFWETDNVEAAGRPWIVLRLADVYLMYCEAVLGNASSTTNGAALLYINQIRSRAGLADLTEITPDNLLYERRVELAFENHRFFDLVRFGKADEILGAFAVSPEAGFVYDSRDLLLPIPQAELAIYDMGQNPGY